MIDKFLASAKAYAALIGAVLTAVAGTLGADTTPGKVVAIVLAVCTALATYAIPNKPQA